jgi:hypothetical protein
MKMTRGSVAAVVVSIAMLAGGVVLTAIAALGIAGWAMTLAGLRLLIPAVGRPRDIHL